MTLAAQDINGDGLDDELKITDDGHISVRLNGQAKQNAQSGWNWNPQNNGQPIVTGVNAKREQYRIADIDGDGRADLVVLDQKTGAATAWLNNGANPNAQPSGWVWSPVGQISQSVGDIAGVRFADVTVR